MSQNNVVSLELALKRKRRQLTDRDRIVFAYHYFEQNQANSAIELLVEIEKSYYKEQFSKDIARALLCHATYKSTLNFAHGKESEFYLVVQRLVKRIITEKLSFENSGYFYLLKDELFKDFM